MAYVLIVDDEPDSCAFVQRFLERHGYSTKCTPNGQEALAEIILRRPDGLVLDVRMPGMDGIQLLEVIRSYLRFHGMPVILLSAHATAEQMDRAQQLGVSAVFHKANFKLVDLLATLQKVVPPLSGIGGA
jgi:CheY-like chemotaxis protein